MGQLSMFHLANFLSQSLPLFFCPTLFNNDPAFKPSRFPLPGSRWVTDTDSRPADTHMVHAGSCFRCTPHRRMCVLNTLLSNKKLGLFDFQLKCVENVKVYVSMAFKHAVVITSSKY